MTLHCPVITVSVFKSPGSPGKRAVKCVCVCVCVCVCACVRACVRARARARACVFSNLSATAKVSDFLSYCGQLMLRFFKY